MHELTCTCIPIQLCKHACIVYEHTRLIHALRMTSPREYVLHVFDALDLFFINEVPSLFLVHGFSSGSGMHGGMRACTDVC